MTPRDDRSFDALERALAETHRVRREPVLGPDWALRIMREVRRGEAEDSQRRPLVQLDHLVWRTATLAAVVALVLAGSVWLYALGDAVEPAILLTSEFDPAAMFME